MTSTIYNHFANHATAGKRDFMMAALGMIKRFWIDTNGALDYIKTLEADNSALGCQSAGWTSKRRIDKPEPLRDVLITMEQKLNSVAGNKKLVEWWAVYLPRDGYVMPHVHSTDWAGVVYVDVDYNDGLLVFNEFDDEYAILPERNLAVIFPGDCMHLVTPSRALHRYSLAMNRV